MKLITAIVNKEDSKNVCNELLKSKFYVTRLATTGGFLMAGNMTLLICTDDERVDDCIGIISKCCKQRTEIVPGTATLGLGIESTMPMEVTVGGATVMVTNVELREAVMLERLAGNDALKAELGTALRGGRLPHAVLLVGEPGCGAGFAARCLAADYLYPAGGPHAEAVLKKEDTECLVLQGEGASGQIPVKKVREAREAIQRSALSTDAAGRVLFIYGAQNLNGSSANAMLKIIEEPPEGVLFLLTATSAATVLPTIRSRCAAYTIAPVPAADCAARLKAERLPAKAAEELAFLYEGHIGTALKSWNDPTAKAALGMAKTLCGYAAQGDTYRALALLTKYERDKDGFAALLWTLDQLCSAVLRRPAYGQEQCGGLTPAGAAKILNADARARKSLTGNGNLRLNVAVLAGEIA